MNKLQYQQFLLNCYVMNVQIFGTAKSKETKKAVEQNPLSLKLMEKDSPAQKSVSQEIEKVTFHDLVVKTENSRPPETVAKLEDCGGIENCEIEITKISYEVVFHFSDEKIQKHQVEWHLSPDVPFFASVLEQCATTLVPIDNLRVLVKQCEKVRDFQF